QLHAPALSVRDGERAAHPLRLLHADVRARAVREHGRGPERTGRPLRGRRVAAHRRGGEPAMTPFVVRLVWWAGIIAWYVIRYPHARRSRKTPIALQRDVVRDRLLLSISFTGLFIVPVTWVTTGAPALADYPFSAAAAWAGTAVFVASLVLFYRTHRD